MKVDISWVKLICFPSLSKFTLGKPFDQKQPSARVENLISEGSNDMIILRKISVIPLGGDGETKEVTSEWKFTEDGRFEMVQTLGDIVATKIYQKKE